MHLLMDLILGIINFIGAIFSDAMWFVPVFLIMGIACVANKYRAAGAFLIFLALMVFVRAIG